MNISYFTISLYSISFQQSMQSLNAHTVNCKKKYEKYYTAHLQHELFK